MLIYCWDGMDWYRMYLNNMIWWAFICTSQCYVILWWLLGMFDYFCPYVACILLYSISFDIIYAVHIRSLQSCPLPHSVFAYCGSKLIGQLGSCCSRFSFVRCFVIGWEFLTFLFYESFLVDELVKSESSHLIPDVPRMQILKRQSFGAPPACWKY